MHEENHDVAHLGARFNQIGALVVMVFTLLFNVSSLPLMFYVVGVLGLFCP